MRKLSGAIAVGLAVAGCGEGPRDDEAGTDATGQRLYPLGTAIWKSLSIPVCWQNPSTANNTERGWVQTAIANTWEATSKVRFTGWGPCSSSPSGVRIFIRDGRPNTLSLGRTLDGVKSGVLLNFTYANWPCVGLRQSCIQGDAVHEFGHVLGFAHEQNRSDRQPCSEPPQAANGNTLVGHYDAFSVMNYCNPAWRLGILSLADQEFVTYYYGHPAGASMKKDVVSWGGAAYFFFDDSFSRFDMGKNRMVDKDPGYLDIDWGGWPSGESWDSGVDAAVDFSATKIYLFSGNQYARVAKINLTVDAGYPITLPGGWINWPSSWTSVDAAVKWPDGKIYMFRGDKYLQITSGTTVDSGFPKFIYRDSSGDRNWKIPYTTGFDQVVPWNNGKAYFFKGNDYIRFDIAAKVTDPGYPLPIVGYWPGVAF